MSVALLLAVCLPLLATNCLLGVLCVHLIGRLDVAHARKDAFQAAHTVPETTALLRAVQPQEKARPRNANDEAGPTPRPLGI